MTLLELIEDGARQFEAAGLSFGHGTTNAFDEAAWLALWKLALPLDTPLQSDASPANLALAPEDIAQVATIFEARVLSRKPAAYLTQEAWLQGFSFYVDERSIVPRSLIAELLVDGSIDYWLSESTQRVLDLCTGNGSIGLIAAHVYPDVTVVGADLSTEALQVAAINVDRHGMGQRMQLVQSDGMAAPALEQAGPFDLILCNPPYVNAQSMAALPQEYRAEPFMALDGNRHGNTDGMDFVRDLFRTITPHMTPSAILVLEIGHERPYFEAAFPHLHAVWLDTSAGADQVLLLTRDALLSSQ